MPDIPPTDTPPAEPPPTLRQMPPAEFRTASAKRLSEIETAARAKSVAAANARYLETLRRKYAND